MVILQVKNGEGNHVMPLIPISVVVGRYSRMTLGWLMSYAVGARHWRTLTRWYTFLVLMNVHHANKSTRNNKMHVLNTDHRTKVKKDGHTGARTQDHSVISTALYRLSYTTSSWYKSIVTVSMDHLLPLQCRSTDCDGLLPFIQRVWKTSIHVALD